MYSQTIRILTLFIYFSLIPLFVYAERTYQVTGTDLYGQNLRALSMGNAFTAVAKTGETALLYNPAGLATSHKERWDLAFAVNAEINASESALNFADDAEALTGNSDPAQIAALINKYEGDLLFVGAKGSGYGYYQQGEPFGWLDRIGVAAQRLVDGRVDLIFVKLPITKISFTNSSGETKPANEIANDAETILANELGIELTPEQKAELEAQIEAQINEVSAEDLALLEEKAAQINDVISSEIRGNALAWDIKSAGLGISIMDDMLKIGLGFKSYDLTSRRGSLSLAKAVGGNTGNLDELFAEKKGSATGFDLGWLLSFDLDWRPQLGLTWQNVGGTDLGSDTDLEIVETFNFGGSLTKEFGAALVVLAADITDISGNYQKSSGGRSFVQRSHVGGELGLGDAAPMENRYIYLRAGYNQGQPTYGVEMSFPYNIIRLGFARIGSDLGNESESIPIFIQTYYLSFGLVI